MERSHASIAALQRVGAGLIAGAAVLFVLATLLLAEIAALLVVAAGLAIYALQQQRDLTPGFAAGLVGSGLLLVLDRQLDPVGSTVARSTVGTMVIGVGIVVAAIVVERYDTADGTE